jgi:hypothetical protein
MGPLLQATRTVPIVFTLGNDPVGSGFMDSLARPGGNATDFMSYEFSIAGKWLELLKEIAPGVTRVAVLRDTSQAFATSMFAAVEVIPVNMRNAAEIDQGLLRVNQLRPTPWPRPFGSENLSARSRFRRSACRTIRLGKGEASWVAFRCGAVSAFP